MIYFRIPDDAEDQIKKNSIISPDEDIICFNDESMSNNIHNSGKIWHKKAEKTLLRSSQNSP